MYLLVDLKGRSFTLSNEMHLKIKSLHGFVEAKDDQLRS